MSSLLLITFALFTSVAPANTQSAPAATALALDDVQLDAVTDALGKGDAAAVADYFDQTVEVVLPGVEDILAKSAAQRALEAFFTDNPTTAFSRVHRGSSPSADGTYVIGSLTCADGKAYRVYVYGSGVGRVAVQELRIEEE